MRSFAVRAVIGLLIFVTAFWTISAGRWFWTIHRPLPGLEEGDGGRCASWFIGSSTISRWRTMAADLAPWRVVNRGVDGANLDEIERRFGRDGSMVPPLAIVIYAGENDIASGRSAKQAASDLVELLIQAKTRWPGVVRIVVALKPSPTRWEQRAEQLRFNDLAGDAARLVGAAFLSNGSQLLVDGRPDPSLYVADGIHLNDRGYRLWGEPVRRALSGRLDRLAPACREATP